MQLFQTVVVPCKIAIPCLVWLKHSCHWRTWAETWPFSPLPTKIVQEVFMLKGWWLKPSKTGQSPIPCFFVNLSHPSQTINLCQYQCFSKKNQPFFEKKINHSTNAICSTLNDQIRMPHAQFFVLPDPTTRNNGLQVYKKGQPPPIPSVSFVPPL